MRAKSRRCSKSRRPKRKERFVLYAVLSQARRQVRAAAVPRAGLRDQRRGGYVMAYFREKLGVGHLRDDRRTALFVRRSRVFWRPATGATCMQVNLEFVYDLTPQKIDAMLAAIRAGTFSVPPMPQTDAAGPNVGDAPGRADLERAQVARRDRRREPEQCRRRRRSQRRHHARPHRRPRTCISSDHAGARRRRLDARSSNRRDRKGSTIDAGH